MAIKYLAGNKLTGTQADRTGLASGVTDYLIDGTLFYEIGVHGNGVNDGNDIWKWDKLADAWELVTGNTETENLSGKTFTDYLLVEERSAPGSSVGSGKGAFYVDSSGVFYGKFENATPINLGAGAGATTLAGLSDTTIGGVTLADGHILVYSAGGTAKWLNKPLSGVSGKVVATLTNAGALDIDEVTDLTDLDMTNANHTIFNNMVSKTLTIGASNTSIITGGNLTVTGDLTVSGDTTIVNTATLSVEDPIILLSRNAPSSGGAVDSGFVVERGTDANVAFVWDENEDEFGAFETTDTGGVAGNIQTGTRVPMRVGGLKAITGAFTGVLSTTSKILVNVADATNITAGADGHLLHIDAVTLNDNSTAASGTAAAFNLVSIEAPTLTVTNASTTTAASTVYISGAPIDGDGDLTITNAYALYVAAGTTKFGGPVEQGATTLSSLTVTGNTSLEGNVDLGDNAADTITVTGQFDSHLIPIADGTYDLGTTTGPKEWKDLWLTGTANIDAIAATTLTDPSVTGTLSMLTAAIIVFEGATADAHETTLTVVDPTADRIIQLPNASDILVGKNTTDTLTLKTLTAPKFANGGFIADINGNEMLVFNATGSAEQHFAMTNAANINVPTVIGPLFAAVGDDTNVALRLSGKGTGGVVIEGGATTGACIEFNTKYTGTNPTHGNESARLYLKEVDAQNNALAVRIFKANAYQEVEITSPKAICGECGSTDGAKDPTYDFSRSMMLVELWCGHAYEVPMTGWNMVS